MEDHDKTKDQLINELEDLRLRISVLEAEKAHEGIVVAQDGMLRFVNPNSAAITGYQVEELISRPLVDFIHPEDRDMVLQAHFRRLRGEDFPSRYSFRIVRKDLEIRRVEIDSGMISWEGRPAALFFMSDVTERKQAEEALRDSQERLELALKGADLGLWDLNLTTGQGMVNQRMLEIIGYSAGEVETSLEAWQQFIHPEDITEVREHIRAHLEGCSDSVDHEYRIRTKSGEYIWVLARGRVLDRDKDNRPLRMVGTVMDVTVRKTAQDALQQSQERLKLALDAAQLGMWDADISTGRLSINERAFEIFGYVPEEIEPTLDVWQSSLHPDDSFSNRRSL